MAHNTSSSIKDWHAKNMNWTATGINVSHNDKLHIAYYGNLMKRTGIASIYTQKCDITSGEKIAAAFLTPNSGIIPIPIPIGYIPGQKLTIRDFQYKIKDGKVEDVHEVVEKGSDLGFIGLVGKAWYERGIIKGKTEEILNKDLDMVKCIIDPNEYGDGKKRERWKSHSFYGFVNAPYLTQRSQLLLQHAHDYSSSINTTRTALKLLI